MRRPFVVLLALLSCATCAACKGSSSDAPQDDGGADGALDMTPTRPPATPVPPVFIGTGGFGYNVGSAFAGAASPQGLVKVGPDTKGPWGTINFLHCAGYWYRDDTIQGITHLHLHGTGATDYGVLSVMPLDAVGADVAKNHDTTFKKESETGSPGYYTVTLDRGAIKVELTAMPHAAHHRYTFAAGATPHVMFDLDHHLDGGSIKDAQVTVDAGKQTIEGKLHSDGGMSGGFGGYDVFFSAKSKQAWTASSTWTGLGAPAAGTTASGTGVGVALDYDPSVGPTIELQVGVSLVDLDGARKNLAAEMPSFDFDTEKQAVSDAWTKLTNVVKFDGGTDDERAMMSAALYHSFLMPTITSDVDGRFPFGGAIDTATDYAFQTDMSLWDTYRTLHPFWALVTPDRDRDAVRSLVTMAKKKGFFPKWAIATGEAGTMIGASAEVVLADAYLKGVRDFDAEGAYAILRAAAMDPTPPAGGRGGRDHVEDYMKVGYVPSPDGPSVSLTIEFAQDDLALGNFAQALGHTDDATTLLARSHSWQRLFDPDTKFLWSKTADGSWATNHYDETNFDGEFDEANAGQTLWGAPHDIDGYVTLFGTRDAAASALENFFEQGKTDYDAVDWTADLSVAEMHPYYWGGNEPDIHAPYLFARFGRPSLAAKWTRWAMHEIYGAGADGLPGNDDGGTMSAWWIFSALGIYPVVGTDTYVLGAPLFSHAEVQVAGGTLTIDAQNAGAQNVYVQSVTLDGAPLDSVMVTHAQLHAGAHLVFTMTSQPIDWTTH